MDNQIKIVAWGDYALPVPVYANWLVQDDSGDWWAFVDKPHRLSNFWSGRQAHLIIDVHIGTKIDPPEPGPWTEQLYWIGD